MDAKVSRRSFLAAAVSLLAARKLPLSSPAPTGAQPVRHYRRVMTGTFTVSEELRDKLGSGHAALEAELARRQRKAFDAFREEARRMYG